MSERLLDGDIAGPDVVGLQCEFQSKPPHRTSFLVLEFNESHRPGALLKSLSDIGWVEDGMAPPSPLDGRQEITVSKRGTGLFGGWTETERGLFLAECQTVLERYLHFDVPHRQLTAADLL